MGLQSQAKDARIKSFLVQQFFKNAGRVQGQRPWSPSASRRNTLRHAFGARRKGVRNATAFRGGSEQDRFPLLNRTDKVKPAKAPRGMFCTTCGVAPAGGSPRRGCPRGQFTPRNVREIVLSRMLRILRAPQGEFMFNSKCEMRN